MKSIPLSLWLSGAFAFYAFKTPIGLYFILLTSALTLALCLFGKCSAFQKAVLCAVMMGAILGGFCAFRLEVTLFTTREKKALRSFILLTHNAEKTAETLYTYLARVRHAHTEQASGEGVRRAKLSTSTAALFVALTTGRRMYVSRALQDIVRRSGISHLLALSGFHLQVLLFFITRFQRVLPRTLFCLSACVLVWLYCLWIGFIPSLWRAACMYTMSALGIVCMGISNFTIIWSLTGFAMMLMFPQALTMPGFVLSMLALYGVVRGGTFYAQVFESYRTKLMSLVGLQALPKVVHACMAHVCSACAVGVGAVATTMWYSMAVFGASYPVGIAASLLLTPVVVFFMIVGISVIGLQCLQGALLFFALRLSVIKACITILAFFMDLLSYSMNALLARLAQAHSISTWAGVVFFYAILIAVCIPYCLNSPRGKSVLRFFSCVLAKLCIARRR